MVAAFAVKTLLSKGALDPHRTLLVLDQLVVTPSLPLDAHDRWLEIYNSLAYDGSVLAQLRHVDLLTAGRAALGVEQVLHAALSVQDVRAGQPHDVGVRLDVHETGHAA